MFVSSDFNVQPLIHGGAGILIRTLPETEFLIEGFFAFGRIQGQFHHVAGLHIRLDPLDDVFHELSADSLFLIRGIHHQVGQERDIAAIPKQAGSGDDFILIPDTEHQVSVVYAGGCFLQGEFHPAGCFAQCQVFFRGDLFRVTKHMLMHKRKIDMADEIYVINVGGYIGTSTLSEIEYAKATGKHVEYLETLAK